VRGREIGTCVCFVVCVCAVQGSVVGTVGVVLAQRERESVRDRFDLWM